MVSKIKTVFFGLFNASASLTAYLWCKIEEWRFRAEHPNGFGTALSNFFWQFSWISFAISALLIFLIVICHKLEKEKLHAYIFYIGLWLIATWLCCAFISTETAFVGWRDLSGVHF